MSAQSSPTGPHVSAPLSPRVLLWTSGQVGLTTFLFGFPAGLVLACIDWMRMGLTNKAITHLVGGAVGALVFIILVILLPGNFWTGLGLLVNIVLLVYLVKQTGKDIETFKAHNREAQDAGWFGGCLIAFVTTGLFLALAFVVAVVLAIFKILVGMPIAE